MTVAILLVACVLLGAAVAALAVALRGLSARLDRLERRPSTLPSASVATPREVDPQPPPLPVVEDYVITRLGQEADEPAPAMEPKLFADVVLRESVVKAASWAYAVRRGLSPENRNRIRFEMRREVKRARKSRKAEEREAIRAYRARRRSAVQESEAA